MTPDQRRRLQLAGAAAARELLAWKAGVGDRLATPELLEAGSAIASAALRAVLGAAREPTAASWSIELAIVPVARDGRGPALVADVVVDLPAEQLPDADLVAMIAELGAGFRDHAAPAYDAELARVRAAAARAAADSGVF